MSQTVSAAPLRIAPESSRWLAGLLLVAHLAAWAVLPWSGLPAWTIAVLAAAVGGSLYYTYTRHVLQRGRRAIRGVVWQASGEWTVWGADGKPQSARLHGESFIHPWLIILNFRLENGSRRALVLLTDSAAPEVLRMLRVRLRLESGREMAE